MEDIFAAGIAHGILFSILCVALYLRYEKKQREKEEWNKGYCRKHGSQWRYASFLSSRRSQLFQCHENDFESCFTTRIIGLDKKLQEEKTREYAQLNRFI